MLQESERSMVQVMRPCRCSLFRTLAILLGLLLFIPAPAEEPSQPAVAAFNAYTSVLESRLAEQHRSPGGFLASMTTTPQHEADLRRGAVRIEQLISPAALVSPGALLHHWRGTAFAPGVDAADFELLMKNVNAYSVYFAPQVLKAEALTQRGDHLEIWMRVRQRHILTVVMDTTYDTIYGRLDAQHGYSLSRSTRITEIDSPGTVTERALNANEEHGFLWRLNTYWSYEERDGGLYIQIESVSLTRSIPRGLGWAVGPFVETIPRESLDFTLRSTCSALQNLAKRNGVQVQSVAGERKE